MKAIDRWIQSYRFNVASRHVPSGVRVLDVGSSDGAFFRHLGSRLGAGVGIDEDVEQNIDFDNFSLVQGRFPDDLPAGEAFDAIVMLAMLEHVQPEHQPALASACFDHLKPGGRVVLTVPAPFVDRILEALVKLRLIDGMAVHQHYGFRPEKTPGIFGPVGFELEKHRRFQLGLNHLFVLRRRESDA